MAQFAPAVTVVTDRLPLGGEVATEQRLPAEGEVQLSSAVYSSGGSSRWAVWREIARSSRSVFAEHPLPIATATSGTDDHATQTTRDDADPRNAVDLSQRHGRGRTPSVRAAERRGSGQACIGPDPGGDAHTRSEPSGAPLASPVQSRGSLWRQGRHPAREARRDRLGRDPAGGQ